MSSDRRPFARFPFVFLLAVAFSSLSNATSHASPQASSIRITSAANVTLRVMPSPDAPAVTQLPLGTELVEAGPSDLEKTWLRVRLADDREGWLQASLTRPLDPAWRWPVFDRIIAERLKRKGDAFPASAELVAFIERVTPEYTDPDGRGRMELARLRAMSAALSAIPFRGGKREPFASWLAARKALVTYDEPGGRWMVTNTAVWDLHAQHASTSSADEIGWFAVVNGLPGECEGRVPCYLSWRNRLHGEYLRRQPTGKHAAEAVTVIKATVDPMAAPSKPAPYLVDPTRDCRDLTQSIDALTLAVQGTRAPDRDAAITSLTSLKKICGSPGT